MSYSQSSYVPSNRAALIASATAHIPGFVSGGEAAGIAPALTMAVTDARDASAGSNQAQADTAEAARLATEKAVTDSATLRSALLAVSQAVSAKARTSPDPDAIYELAGLSPRKTASKRPAPLAPSGLKVTLGTDGTVSLKWTATSTGTVFNVLRQVTDQAGVAGPWSPLFFNGRKPMVDADVPVGSRQVAYQVQANRGGTLSPWSEPTGLRFGASSAQPSALKIAA